MGLKLVVLVAAASWAWPVAAGDAKEVDVRFYNSPDGMEVYVVAAAPAELGGPRLYYFSNDASRICYTFTVAGSWKLDKVTGQMQSEDGRGRLGQKLLGPDELGTGSGPELVKAAIEIHQAWFAENLSSLAAQGVKGISQPVYSAATFPAAGHEAVNWTALATGRIKGQDASIGQREVLVEVVPGWVLALEARDDVAREAIESLGTAEPPDCYRPFIRKHFPAIPVP